MTSPHALLFVVVLATASPVLAQPTTSVPAFDLYSGLRTVVPEGVNAAGLRKDYRTVISHPDGSITIITDEGDVHKVEGSGVVTQQTVGRGASHLDVIRTHYRPLDGDQIVAIERIFPNGHSTKIFPSAAIQAEMRARAAANAAGSYIQQQQIANAHAHPPPQPPAPMSSHERAGSHPDRDMHRESHPHVELGEGSVTVKDKGPH